MPPLRAPQKIISIDFHSHLLTATFPAQTPVTPVIMAIFTRNRKGIEEWMGTGQVGWVGSLRPQRRPPFVCPARSRGGAAEELGTSSTFHAFSKRGDNCAVRSLVGGQDELIGQAVAGTAVRWLNKSR